MLALLYTTLLAVAPSPPLCAEPSHDRLVVRVGRDVCAAALSAAGEPRGAGFLPTRCPRRGDDYRVDARGRQDVCMPGEPAKGRGGGKNA